MDTSSAVSFGSKLRAARRRQGLSQAELGGDRYSGSYISHLESGRRQATRDVVDFVSRRLGVSPLEWGLSTAEVAATGADPIEDLLVAERAWSDHDWAAAIQHSAQAAAIAEAAGDPGRNWEALYVLARARMSSGDFAGAAQLAEQIADHPTATRFAVARAQALSLASIAHRADDRLGWAVALGARAVEAAAGAPPIILAEALMALVSAMFEAGHPAAESEPYLSRLDQLTPQLSSDHSRGMISWTLGTAAFMAGDVEQGLAHYQRAGELLDPRRDLRLWLRYHRSAARVRLDAGILDGVADLVQTASLGLQILGNNHDVVELRQVEAKLALLTGEAERGAQIMSEVLNDPVLGAPEISRGGSEQILAEALDALGYAENAAEHFRLAGQEYEREGRLWAAVEAWRRGAAVAGTATIS